MKRNREEKDNCNRYVKKKTTQRNRWRKIGTDEQVQKYSGTIDKGILKDEINGKTIQFDKLELSWKEDAPQQMKAEIVRTITKPTLIYI